jgi:hypothetical protein
MMLDSQVLHGRPFFNGDRVEHFLAAGRRLARCGKYCYETPLCPRSAALSGIVPTVRPPSQRIRW